ncbi:hypothetical protein RSOLAG1IB_06522 [Rhizoctonia solani AG-1 IB]|uniref:BTB domain-containing protein n=1 Tax=Thanatephorus cucumeris (strain AG1-IB / isolate 7/3/14) TaxID=1108050 RepID=A0A0B7FBT3_THACB|nr:hypothetical protein RSOLAG1IB_06522 [Rhizoctonia solani AG-1 IB]
MEKVDNINTVNDTCVYKHPCFYFDDTLIFIKIESTLFTVHKSRLLESKEFSRCFKSQESSQTQERNEGLSAEFPITLQDIELSDFEAFLKVLYAPEFSNNQPSPDVALIISAYRLALLWQFSKLQKFLLSFTWRSFGDVDRVAFAKEFGLKEWLFAPLVNLCQRDEPLALGEARKIGVDSLSLISRLREAFPPQMVTLQRASSSSSIHIPLRSKRSHNSTTSRAKCVSCLQKDAWVSEETELRVSSCPNAGWNGHIHV